MVGFHYVKDSILALSINTGASIQKAGDPVLVAPTIFKQIETHIKTLSISREVFRVFVLHHHLLPFAEPEWKMTYDPKIVRERPDNTIVANTVAYSVGYPGTRSTLSCMGTSTSFTDAKIFFGEIKSLNDERSRL